MYQGQGKFVLFLLQHFVQHHAEHLVQQVKHFLNLKMINQ
jgi:hypothetical protein